MKDWLTTATVLALCAGLVALYFVLQDRLVGQ